MADVKRTTVAVTGANRGIGRAILLSYLSRPSHTLLAFVRNPGDETCQSLLSEPAGADSKVHLVPYNASEISAAEGAIQHLSTNHPEVMEQGIDSVIANAGMNDYSGPSLDASPDVYLAHYTTNTLGPLLLFKATFPLLKLAAGSSSSPSKFIAISSAGGSTTVIASRGLAFDPQGKPRPGALPYGTSKCALNHIMAKVSLECSGQGVVFGLWTPGPTKTGLGGGKFDWSRVPGVQPIEVVVPGLVAQFDELGADGKTDQGVILKDWSGKVFNW